MTGALDIQAVTSHYQALARMVPFKAITREAEYRKAVAALEELLDAGGANKILRVTVGRLIKWKLSKWKKVSGK